MKTFWILMLILDLMILARDIAIDRPLWVIGLDLAFVGLAIFWVEREHSRDE